MKRHSSQSAKWELRESFKTEIDNLFKSPEQVEDEFQRYAKTPRLQAPRTPSESHETSKDPTTPCICLKLNRLGDGERVGCEHLASFVHFALFGSILQRPRWIAIARHRNVLQNLVIRVNVEEDFFETTNLSFPNEFFNRQWIEMDGDISDRNLFWHSLMNVRLSLPEVIRRKSEKMQKTFDELGKHDKSHFVLSTAQLAERNYPFPGQEGIVPTKNKYKQLSTASPMFSIDCEMCETTLKNRALTRISIIDESENTILDTLVKPEGVITDYVTKFSGITEKMMKGVTTTLCDVQKAVQSLLPPDAILVGHSLEHDLNAMKMSHPYCLDVGYALNYTNEVFGSRNSLKNLTELFLGEKIQSKFGHCSYEDAWAAMRLAQLKIEKGIVFGNTRYGWKYHKYAQSIGDVMTEISTSSDSVRPVPCTDCSSPTVVGCSVESCRCLMITGPSKCVQCLKTGECVEGDFDWRESLPDDSECSTPSPIHTYLAKDKTKTVMCAFEPQGLDFLVQTSKKVHSKNPSSFASYDNFIGNVASTMLNDSLILMEIDKEKVEPLKSAVIIEEDGVIPDNAEALNQHLEKLVAATSKNALILIIFSSPKKNILYTRVK